jgi:hypothetical protein
VTEPRRFPPPWSVEEPDPKLARQWCYIVRDANGHALAYVYFEDEPSGFDHTDFLSASALSASQRSCGDMSAILVGRVGFVPVLRTTRRATPGPRGLMAPTRGRRRGKNSPAPTAKNPPIWGARRASAAQKIGT